MKRFKKVTALFASIIMAVSAFAVSSFAEDGGLSGSKSTLDLLTSVDVEMVSSDENWYESDTVLSCTAPISSDRQLLRGYFNGGDYIFNTDSLTSDDAVDFYGPFSVSGTRTAVMSLTTTNTDYIALLCPYDPSTGEVTVSTNFSVTAGNAQAYTYFNNDSYNNYVAVILNLGSTYGTEYTFAMNAKNPGNATSFLYASTDLSRVVFRYSNNDVYSNGTNVTDAIVNFLNNEMGTNSFQDRYLGPSPSSKRATVGVTSGPQYILEDGSLYYGWYSSTNTTSNLETGLGHSSSEVVFIPIEGYGYTCSVSGTYIPYTLTQGTATGFLVYDINNDAIIDWMSSSNVLYTPNGYFGFTYSYGVYADLEIPINNS